MNDQNLNINKHEDVDKVGKSDNALNGLRKHSPMLKECSKLMMHDNCSSTTSLAEPITTKCNISNLNDSTRSLVSTQNSPTTSALESFKLLANNHIPVNDKKPSGRELWSNFSLSSLFFAAEGTNSESPSESTPIFSNILTSLGLNIHSNPTSPTLKSETLETTENLQLVFGLSLREATSNTKFNSDIPLPRLVVRCVEYLDNEGLNEVGLYRIPGSTSLVNQLKVSFDQGEDIDLNELCPDPHAVATLLKLYLRQLPEPILTSKILTQINQFLTNSKGPDTTLPPHVPTHVGNRSLYLAGEVKLLLTSLPDPHYYLLHWLTRHLARVDRNSAINKMTLSNLGVIFCPSLGLSSTLFRLLIDHNSLLFPLPRPRDKTAKVKSPRPYSVSSVQSRGSNNSVKSIVKLIGNSNDNGNKVADSNKVDSTARNRAKFEDLAALHGLDQLMPSNTSYNYEDPNGSIPNRGRNSILSYQSFIPASKELDPKQATMLDTLKLNNLDDAILNMRPRRGNGSQLRPKKSVNLTCEDEPQTSKSDPKVTEVEPKKSESNFKPQGGLKVMFDLPKSITPLKKVNLNRPNPT